MKPLVFEPHFRPQVWGGRDLERLLGKLLPPGESIGESWEISAQAHHISRVAEGPHAGTPLTDLWASRAAELWGRSPVPGAPPCPARFPLLVKLLDCRELLSVQVHPDDALAKELLGEPCGKTECWVVLAAEPTARIYAGLRPGTTRDELETRLSSGTVAECLHSFAPKAGDCLLMRAGTVHAVGGGVLMAEVQQSSDATFRLFDWNRLGRDGKPRELHIAQSLRSIDWSIGPVEPCRPAPTQGWPDGVAGERLIDCPLFEIHRFRASQRLVVPFAGRLAVWMVLDGTAQLQALRSDYRRALSAGETVLIPATAEPLVWEPPGNRSVTLLAALP